MGKVKEAVKKIYELINFTVGAVTRSIHWSTADGTDFPTFRDRYPLGWWLGSSTTPDGCWCQLMIYLVFTV